MVVEKLVNRTSRVEGPSFLWGSPEIFENLDAWKCLFLSSKNQCFVCNNASKSIQKFL